MNMLYVLYETFWNFVSAVAKHDYRDCNRKICNQSKSYETFIANIEIVKS